MPANKPTPGPDSTPAAPADDTPKTNGAPAPTASAGPARDTEQPAPGEVPAGRLAAGTYEYVWPIATQYLEVPLTAHPAYPEQPATDETEAVPARPATVFTWPFSAPDDGRWVPSKKKPNTLPDNAPANPEE